MDSDSEIEAFVAGTLPVSAQFSPVVVRSILFSLDQLSLEMPMAPLYALEIAKNPQYEPPPTMTALFELRGMTLDGKMGSTVRAVILAMVVDLDAPTLEWKPYEQVLAELTGEG